MKIEFFYSFKPSWNCLNFILEDEDYPKNQENPSRNKSRFTFLETNLF